MKQILLSFIAIFISISVYADTNDLSYTDPLIKESTENLYAQQVNIITDPVNTYTYSNDKYLSDAIFTSHINYTLGINSNYGLVGSIVFNGFNSSTSLGVGYDPVSQSRALVMSVIYDTLTVGPCPYFKAGISSDYNLSTEFGLDMIRDNFIMGLGIVYKNRANEINLTLETDFLFN